MMNNDFTINHFVQLDFDDFRQVLKIDLKLIEIRILIKGNILDWPLMVPR